MKYSHWELLNLIYRQQQYMPVYKFQCNKTLLKTCLKNGWIEEFENETIKVTEKGKETAKEITALTTEGEDIITM